MEPSSEPHQLPRSGYLTNLPPSEKHPHFSPSQVLLPIAQARPRPCNPRITHRQTAGDLVQQTALPLPGHAPWFLSSSHWVPLGLALVAAALPLGPPQAPPPGGVVSGTLSQVSCQVNCWTDVTVQSAGGPQRAAGAHTTQGLMIQVGLSCRTCCPRWEKEGSARNIPEFQRTTQAGPSVEATSPGFSQAPKRCLGQEFCRRAGQDCCKKHKS